VSGLFGVCAHNSRRALHSGANNKPTEPDGGTDAPSAHLGLNERAYVLLQCFLPMNRPGFSGELRV
jgi:hypothetical protein